MFENLRRTLRDLLDASASSSSAPASLAQMRDTLVQARVGLGDLHEGLEESRRQVAAKRQELDTVRRRKGQAQAINDAETVAVAERYESVLAERVAVLEEKVRVQEAEYALAEQDVSAMTAELKRAMGGIAPPPRAESIDPLADPEREALNDEIASLERSRRRATRDADAESRLADLKRRMGK